MVTITCDSCHRQLSLDETKVPPKETSFPCPMCKAPVAIDGRKFSQPTPSASVITAPQLSQPALIVGLDDAAVRQAAMALGFQPHFIDSFEAAREFLLHEFPPVVFLRPSQISAPPMEQLLELTQLNPVDRRRVFMILVADNIRTFDGNAAFLYGVNLVVATRDLPSIQQIYRDAEIHHRRLYQSLFSLQERGEHRF